MLLGLKCNLIFFNGQKIIKKKNNNNNNYWFFYIFLIQFCIGFDPLLYTISSPENYTPIKLGKVVTFRTPGVGSVTNVPLLVQGKAFAVSLMSDLFI